jgi:uncharacterized protein (DUF169 family)
MTAASAAVPLQDALGLEIPPVALTFVDEKPADLPVPAVEHPSSCSFWRAAETGTFYASASQHFNCPIGSMVMGFELPEEVQSRLGELVGGMCEQRYLSADEPAQIPAVKTRHLGIVYGPLAETAGTPDVVLLWVTARQAMLCNEAMGTAAWTTGYPTTTGRPGCAALPLAIAQDAPTMSFGCAGMRTFTGIPDDRMLIVVPGDQLAAFAKAIAETVAVNARMTDTYREQRARLASAADNPA